MDTLPMQLTLVSIITLFTPIEAAGNPFQNNQIVTDEGSSSNLTCFTCSTFDNYACRTFNASTDESLLIPRKDCKSDESFCSVTRVEYMTNERVVRKFWALERGCSSICIPGCIILGEGERTKLHLCNSCCTSSLCNVNDKGTNLDPGLNTSILIIVVKYFLFYHHFS